MNVTHDESVVPFVEKVFRGHFDEPVRTPRCHAVSEPLARPREEGGKGIGQVGGEESCETYYGPAPYYCFKGLVSIVAGEEVVAVGYHHTSSLDLVDDRYGEDLHTESVGEIRFEPVVMVATGDEDFGPANGEPADHLEDITVIAGEDFGVFEPEIECIANEIEARSALDGPEKIAEKDPFSSFTGVQLFGPLFMVLEMSV